MGAPIQLNHIDNSLVGYKPGLPGFEALVASYLAGIGDASDTFDVELGALILSTASMDSLFVDSDSAFADLGNAVATVDALNPADILLDFGNGVPVIDRFLFNLSLKKLSTISLP